MVDNVELFLSGDDFVLFFRGRLIYGLRNLFGVFLAAGFFRVNSSLGRRWWWGFLFLLLRAIFLLNFWLLFCCMATFLGSSPKLFQFNS